MEKKDRISRDDPSVDEGRSSPGLGSGRGGFSSNIHLACDGRGLPFAVIITGGQRHEAAFFVPLMDPVRVMQPTGRPRTRPEAVAEVKAYDAQWIRQGCLARNIELVIPARTFTGSGAGPGLQ